MPDHPHRRADEPAASGTAILAPLALEHPQEHSTEADRDLDLYARYVCRSELIERDLHDSIEGAAHLFHHL